MSEAEVLEYVESRDFHPIVPSVLMIKTEGRARLLLYGSTTL